MAQGHCFEMCCGKYIQESQSPGLSVQECLLSVCVCSCGVCSAALHVKFDLKALHVTHTL